MRKPLRCPKCGSGELLLTEHSVTLMVFYQDASGNIHTEDREEGVDYLHIDAECCACAYRWRVRGVKAVCLLPNFKDSEPERTP